MSFSGSDYSPSTPSTSFTNDSLTLACDDDDDVVVGEDSVCWVPTEDERRRIFQLWPEWTCSERARPTSSWVWQYGFEIQHDNTRRWICMVCLRSRRGRPVHFESRGTQNVENHLWKQHRRWDPSRRRNQPSEGITKRAFPSIVQSLGLVRSDPSHLAMANQLISGFDGDRFHALCVNWVVESQLSFRAVESPRLRLIFEYLNPNVKVRNAHLYRQSLRNLAIAEHTKYMATVKEALSNSVGLIHIAFDGARSRNRHALFGVTAAYMSHDLKVKKVVLGLPELAERHTGNNIAAEIVDVIKEYEICDKVGFFSLDNATNNDTAMQAIGDALGFDGKQRRVRCIGHIINLVVKALLFGKVDEDFDELVDDGTDTTATEAHDAWMKKGPVGKAHNFAVWAHRSDLVTNQLRKLQAEGPDETVNDQGNTRKVLPVDVIVDNDTRWLSQYYMIKRLIRLRPYYDDLIRWAQRRAPPSIQKSRCVKPDSILDDNDWAVLEAFHELLHDFHIVVMMLEGDGQSRQRYGGAQRFGLMTDVLIAFELLLSSLEKVKNSLHLYPEPKQFSHNVELGWDKLNEYYLKLVDSPVYYAAVALHPAYRWQYFHTAWEGHKERDNWLQEAKSIIQSLWDKNYRDMVIPGRSSTPYALQAEQPEPARKRARLSTFAEYQERHRIRSTRLQPELNFEAIDEWAQWQVYPRPGDSDVKDPIAYWISNQDEYPRLARMAFDVMTVPAMSAECERLFSAMGLMVTPLRARLDASTIGTIQTLRSWLQAGLIDNLDPTLSDITCQDLPP